MSNSLQGRVVAITGASSGIGEATARRLARSGAFVVLGARRMGRLSSIVADIERAGGRAIALELDVQQRGQVQAFVDGAVRDSAVWMFSSTMRASCWSPPG
ncbi:SDR family NAD(P)-dependent oxidoreductase [Komagataeibacter rhaeticus]|nr:SDR family NAD(P)-dependent oxidoreductase [Komagataeibacter rhaeticus]